MTYIGIVNDDYLEHHGVKGMKWGVRRGGRRGNKNYLTYPTKRGKSKRLRLRQKEVDYLNRHNALDSEGNAKGPATARNIANSVKFRRNLKRFAIGTGVAGATVAGLYAANHLTKGKVGKSISAGASYAKRHGKSFATNVKKAGYNAGKTVYGAGQRAYNSVYNNASRHKPEYNIYNNRRRKVSYALTVR